MSLLFITGSGTDVGKTYLTALLVRQLRTRGIAVRAVKPVISGFDPIHPEGSDSALLLQAMGEAVTRETIAAISPWRYAAPLAPNMAAQREGRTIDFDAIVAWCRKPEGKILIEGVGGVMSPISDDHTGLDWIAALGCPALLVCGSYLGAISHTLTAIEAMRSRGTDLAGIAVSESQDGVDLDETIATLGRFARGVPVLAVARSSAAEEVRLSQVADLCTLAGKCLAD